MSGHACECRRRTILWQSELTHDIILISLWYRYDCFTRELGLYTTLHTVYYPTLPYIPNTSHYFIYYTTRYNLTNTLYIILHYVVYPIPISIIYHCLLHTMFQPHALWLHIIYYVSLLSILLYLVYVTVLCSYQYYIIYL